MGCPQPKSYIGRHIIVNPFKDKLRLLQLRPSPYRAVNNFLLGYKNLSVYAVSGTSRCLFSDKYKTHKYSVGRVYGCWMLNCWCITWPVGFRRLEKKAIGTLRLYNLCYNFSHLTQYNKLIYQLLVVFYAGLKRTRNETEWATLYSAKDRNGWYYNLSPSYFPMPWHILWQKINYVSYVEKLIIIKNYIQY